MPSIPHSFAAPLSAPIVSFALAFALAYLCRDKGRSAWLPATAGLATLIGWALLTPSARLLHDALMPRLAPEVLLVPASIAVMTAAFAGWRRSASHRAISVALALFGGWWVARVAVGPNNFWRVLFGIAALAWTLSKVVDARPERGLAFALALWGGLAVAGSPLGMTWAAAVAAAGWFGLVAAPGRGTLPVASMAVLLGAADLAGGRLTRGKFDAVDLACLLALLSPFVAEAAAVRFGKNLGRFGLVASSAAGAACMVGIVWGVRHAFFT